MEPRAAMLGQEIGSDRRRLNELVTLPLRQAISEVCHAV